MDWLERRTVIPDECGSRQPTDFYMIRGRAGILHRGSGIFPTLNRNRTVFPRSDFDTLSSSVKPGANDEPPTAYIPLHTTE